MATESPRALSGAPSGTSPRYEYQRAASGLDVRVNLLLRRAMGLSTARRSRATLDSRGERHRSGGYGPSKSKTRVRAGGKVGRA